MRARAGLRLHSLELGFDFADTLLLAQGEERLREVRILHEVIVWAARPRDGIVLSP